MYLKAGVINDFLWLALLTGALLYYFKRVDEGKPVPQIRTLPALLAIEEGVGRCEEMGRPVHYCPGHIGRLSGEFGPAILASLNIMKYTIGLCVDLDVPIHITIPYHPEIIPLVESIYEETCRELGKPEMYDPSHVYFLSGAAGRAAMIGLVVKENVALNIETGPFYTEIATHAVARDIGAINIGGTTRWVAMYGQAIVCDYLTITEEIFAMGAKASKDQSMISSIAAEDIGKFVGLALGCLALIFGIVGITGLSNLLGM